MVPPVIATVREWRDEDGWGILDAEVGDVFVHFSNIEMKRNYKSLKPGQQVEFDLVGPLPPIEGCRYAA
jgi:CspA family cold shock protein